jgi:hypothetical protein
MDDRTMPGRRDTDWRACPFVNHNDERCSSRFSLGRIDQAFSVCFGSYRACPMYHRISGEVSRYGTPNTAVAVSACGMHEPPFINVTTNGRAMPLRRTGT